MPLGQLKASAYPEIWPAPSQFNRPCQGAVYTHPATPYNPASYYDSFGYCNPAMPAYGTAPAAPTSSSLIPGEWGGMLTKVLLWGGLAVGAWYLWTHRSEVMGYFSK